MISVGARAPLWGDSVPELQPGPVAMITQSGNLAVNAIGSRRGIDFHTLVSAGNQTVLDAADWLAAVAARDGVRSIALFLEEDGDGARLAEALALCAERGVGVAVLKVGESRAGAAAAAAHTGAVAGDQRAFRALVEEAGAAWVRDPHELLEVARVLAEPRARPGAERGPRGPHLLRRGLGDRRGPGEQEGMELPPLAEGTKRKLAEILPDAATPGNPLDYTSLIWGESELLASIVETVGADPAIDQLLLLYDHPAGLRPEHEDQWRAVRTGLADGAERCDAAALIASTLPDLLDDAAARELAARGIPVGRRPRQPRWPASGRSSAGRATRSGSERSPPRPLAARAGANGKATTSWMGEAAAKRLLRDGGVPVPEGVELERGDEDGCVAAASELGWPVALKLSGRAVRHKTRHGRARSRHRWPTKTSGEPGVVWSPSPRRTARACWSSGWRSRASSCSISARADAVVPVVTVGLGGIWTEALRRRRRSSPSPRTPGGSRRGSGRCGARICSAEAGAVRPSTSTLRPIWQPGSEICSSSAGWS